jgi:SAM-dependent methyltransferase
LNLLEIVNRAPTPEPWDEGEKIPWDDPDFSQRMLAEHLTDAHDRASRRSAIIDAHVDWIDRVVLGGTRSRILDLGCGPGLYTARLAARGHTCVGVDFGPASIDYAIREAATYGHDCHYHLADLREANVGTGYDLVMLIYGEFNVFRRDDAQAILDNARRALKMGGRLLLEVHTVAAIEQLGLAPRSWRTSQRGLFSDRPHVLLEEAFWDAGSRIATERYYVIDADTANVTRYAQSIQAYTDAEFEALLTEAGFTLTGTFAGFGDTGSEGFYVLVAEC